MERKDIIHYSQCQHKPILSLKSICEIAQDCFSETTAEMGCDNITLREQYHCMWVFTKHKVSVLSPLAWREQVTIRCRSVKAVGLRNYMLTEIVDAKGVVCVTSLVESCVIDTETFKLRKLDTIPFSGGNEEIDLSFDTKNIEKDCQRDFVVTPTMIDYSHHMNNVETVNALLQILSLEEMDKYITNSFECVLQYRNQAKLGEQLTLHFGKSDGVVALDLKKQDGKEVSSAVIKLL